MCIILNFGSFILVLVLSFLHLFIDISFNSDFRLNLLPDPFLYSGTKGYQSNPYCSSSSILTWNTLLKNGFDLRAVMAYHLAFSGILLVSHFLSIIPSVTSSSFLSFVEHDQSDQSSH